MQKMLFVAVLLCDFYANCADTGCFFRLVPPRKVLSMELVPPNSKKWLSTLVPPKATRRAKNNQSQRIFTLSEWCSAALFKHYYTIFLVFIQLQNMWIRSFRAFSPQKLHHLQRRRLEPFLSSSSRLLSPCPAFGCWSRQPHVRHDGGARQACEALGDKSLPRKGHKLRHLIFNWGHLKVTMKPEVSRGKVRTVCWPVLHSPPTPASHKPVTKNALQEVQGGVRRVQRSSILESEWGIG